jgi:hypothetical protein
MFIKIDSEANDLIRLYNNLMLSDQKSVLLREDGPISPVARYECARVILSSGVPPTYNGIAQIERASSSSEFMKEKNTTHARMQSE